MSETFIPADLVSYLQKLEAQFDQIPQERRAVLEKLGSWVAEQLRNNRPAHIVVICTHNSRRSHMGQVMLALAAKYLGLEDVHTWSGGTEATSIYPEVVKALERAGVPIERITDGPNPRYRLEIDGLPEAERTLFSKRFDSTPNPKENFAAVMVCSEADAGCPFVPGASARFSLPYRDPKESDGLPSMEATYDERLEQIGREFLYAMHLAKESL
ncbi:MAG: arsenate reductase [Saprospiraceae bacterium]|nr:MAG: arsenate reductase [Saprospiraceae bacterium]